MSLNNGGVSRRLPQMTVGTAVHELFHPKTSDISEVLVAFFPGPGPETAVFIASAPIPMAFFE